jgi:hypothetical protein
MNPYQLAIFTDQDAASLIADESWRATDLHLTTGQHGFESIRATLPMRLPEAFRRYDLPGLPHCEVNGYGSRLAEGRVEDMTITSVGVDLTALGYSRALSDAPYTALWSTTDYSRWRAVTARDTPARTPDKYNIDFNGRIYLSTKKGQVYTNGADIGAVVIQAPHGGSRQIVGFSFDFTLNLPTIGVGQSWQFGFNRWQEGWTAGAGTQINVGAGIAYTETRHYTFAGCDYLELFIYNITGANSAPAGEDGANFVEIRNLRVVTTTANRVNTTGGAAIPNAGTFTRTPASMANIYVGQSLEIEQGTNTSERVTVTAITATTFTATYLQGAGHPINFPVQAHVVHADEIAADLAATVASLNGQIGSSSALIQSPGIDLLDEVYEDRLPSDILTYLIGLGDTTLPPRQWEWGVWEDRLLYFRPRGSAAKTWYVGVSELAIERTLEQLANSVYGVYRDAYGRALRTTASVDGTSVSRYGLTRRLAVSADTTSSVQASVQQDALLSDHADPIPRASITFDAVFDASGGWWPLSLVRAGDTITIRNLPPTISSDIDRIRTFRLWRTDYDAVANTITVEPEAPSPLLAILLARLGAGISLPVGRVKAAR